MVMYKKILVYVVLTVGLAVLPALSQSIRLPRFIASGMVVQRESNVPFWGWTTPGTTVEVSTSWSQEVVSAIADSKGKFTVTLNTPVAGGPYSIRFSTAVSVVNLTDVLSGEVWLCSGQSNMKMRLGEAEAWRVQSDNNSNIRFFEVSVARAAMPQDTVKGGQWRYGVVPGNMQHISAVGYYFARRMQEKLNIPVGMIGSYEGGTNIEEWTDAALMSTMPELLSAYTVPSAGREAGCLYNAMIHPLLPFKFAGIIWYQGENNVSRIQHYEKNQLAMVTDWRTKFGSLLPFYFVQLTSFSSSWMEFREMQEKSARSMSNAGMVVTIDAGDPGNIHPIYKKPVGDRLADLALSKTYGQTSLSHSSPLFRKKVKEGKAMRVYFQYADKGLKITSGEQPNLFEIAGSDGVFVSANARIEGNTVLVWSEKVPQPISVRYFWKNYATPNLFTTDGLPVAPFRSIN